MTADEFKAACLSRTQRLTVETAERDLIANLALRNRSRSAEIQMVSKLSALIAALECDAKARMHFAKHGSPIAVPPRIRGCGYIRLFLAGFAAGAAAGLL